MLVFFAEHIGQCEYRCQYFSSLVYVVLDFSVFVCLCIVLVVVLCGISFFVVVCVVILGLFVDVFVGIGMGVV